MGHPGCDEIAQQHVKLESRDRLLWVTDTSESNYSSWIHQEGIESGSFARGEKTVKLEKNIRSLLLPGDTLILGRLRSNRIFYIRRNKRLSKEERVGDRFTAKQLPFHRKFEEFCRNANFEIKGGSAGAVFDGDKFDLRQLPVICCDHDSDRIDFSKSLIRFNGPDFVILPEERDARAPVIAKLGPFVFDFQPGGKGGCTLSVDILAPDHTRTTLLSHKQGRFQEGLPIVPFNVFAFYSGYTHVAGREQYSQEEQEAAYQFRNFLKSSILREDISIELALQAFGFGKMLSIEDKLHKQDSIPSEEVISQQIAHLHFQYLDGFDKLKAGRLVHAFVQARKDVPGLSKEANARRKIERLANMNVDTRPEGGFPLKSLISYETLLECYDTLERLKCTNLKRQPVLISGDIHLKFTSKSIITTNPILKKYRVFGKVRNSDGLSLDARHISHKKGVVFDENKNEVHEVEPRDGSTKGYWKRADLPPEEVALHTDSDD